jgi:dishevelled associated activator of morphogenesis
VDRTQKSKLIELTFPSRLSRAILSMDSNDQLPIDMVEQLLKFTPSAEERVLLDEHSDDIDSLARADRFLYEISK